MEVTGKVKKIFQNTNNHVIILDNDLRLSGFGKVPEGLEEKETYRFEYVQKGQYNNYAKFDLVHPDGPKAEVTYEDVKNSEEKKSPDIAYAMEDVRQKIITLGQAANLAQERLHWGEREITPGEYDNYFRQHVKYFYATLRSLQKELVE